MKKRKYRVEFTVSVSGWLEVDEADILGEGIEFESMAQLRRRLGKRMEPAFTVHDVYHNRTEAPSAHNWPVGCTPEAGKITNERWTKVRIVPLASPLEQLAEQAE